MDCAITFGTRLTYYYPPYDKYNHCHYICIGVVRYRCTERSHTIPLNLYFLKITLYLDGGNKAVVFSTTKSGIVRGK